MTGDNKITCRERGILNNEVIDYFEITADGKVWPCCWFLSCYIRMEEPGEEIYWEAMMEDPVFSKLYNQDPNWNNLYYHDLETITQHEFFKEHVNINGWESDNPPFLCNLYCSKNAIGMKGYHLEKHTRQQILEKKKRQNDEL